MSEGTAKTVLGSEEAQRKAEMLFSKKFMEYLSTKKQSGTTPETWHPPRDKPASSSSDDTSISDSSRKSVKKTKKKSKKTSNSLDFNYAFRNKLTQCSLLKNAEEVAEPEELKTLLVNLTIFLQDLKLSPPEYEALYSLISRITIFVTEFVRRPIKKLQEKKDHSKNLDKTIEEMMNLLEEYKNGAALDSENEVREYKRIEKEIAIKDQEIADAKKKLTEGNPKPDPKPKDMNARVRDSVLLNEKLKTDIKFNQAHIKKYKKILLEKEWMKHKVETELGHLKKKLSRGDLPEGGSEGPDPKSKSPEPGSGGESAAVKPKTTVKGKREKDKQKVTVK